jgi:galactitol PTS system EIIB component
MKKIIVACGGAVATSTLAAEKIRELCQREGIAADVQQCRIPEIPSLASEVDLIVTTARVDTDYGKPTLHGIAFVSGIGEEALEEKILTVLR